MNSRTMLSLPPLTFGEAEYCLPMCDATAIEVLGAIVESDPGRAVSQLCSTMAMDPAFAVWAVCCNVFGARDNSAADRPNTVFALANWLGPQLMNLFGPVKTS